MEENKTATYKLGTDIWLDQQVAIQNSMTIGNLPGKKVRAKVRNVNNQPKKKKRKSSGK